MEPGNEKALPACLPDGIIWLYMEGLVIKPKYVKIFGLNSLEEEFCWVLWKSLIISHGLPARFGPSRQVRIRVPSLSSEYMSTKVVHVQYSIQQITGKLSYDFNCVSLDLNGSLGSKSSIEIMM